MLCKINGIHFFLRSVDVPIHVSDLYPKSKYLFSLDELVSTPYIITFLPNPVPGNEKLPCLSSPIPYPEYLYLSTSAFLFKVAARNKKFSSVA